MMAHTGNLGTAILQRLVHTARSEPGAIPFSRFLACVRSERSHATLLQTFSGNEDIVTVYAGENVKAVQSADAVILGADPADVEQVLTAPGLRSAFGSKPLISVVAGWSRSRIEQTLYGSETTTANAGDGRGWVIRTLPNIAALVSQSMTVIEISEPQVLPAYLELTERVFHRVGKTLRLDPRFMDAASAVAGSTPAFFAIICDALIDAAVAVGMPRDAARTMICQSMLGSATVLGNGAHPAELRDQGTSPEGCTIAGVMVLEEGAVRGHIGRALREAVTVARRMGTDPHVNDTRHDGKSLS